jgi:hypothetical protein
MNRPRFTFPSKRVLVLACSSAYLFSLTCFYLRCFKTLTQKTTCFLSKPAACIRDLVLKGGRPEYGLDGDLLYSFDSFAGVFN